MQATAQKKIPKKSRECPARKTRSLALFVRLCLFLSYQVCCSWRPAVNNLYFMPSRCKYLSAAARRRFDGEEHPSGKPPVYGRSSVQNYFHGKRGAGEMRAITKLQLLQ